MGGGRGLSLIGVNTDCIEHKGHALKCHNYLNTSENIDDNTTDFLLMKTVYVCQLAM